jgi:hypothetical protein
MLSAVPDVTGVVPTTSPVRQTVTAKGTARLRDCPGGVTEIPAAAVVGHGGERTWGLSYQKVVVARPPGSRDTGAGGWVTSSTEVGPIFAPALSTSHAVG